MIFRLEVADMLTLILCYYFSNQKCNLKFQTNTYVVIYDNKFEWVACIIYPFKET